MNGIFTATIILKFAATSQRDAQLMADAMANRAQSHGNVVQRTNVDIVAVEVDPAPTP